MKNLRWNLKTKMKNNIYVSTGSYKNLTDLQATKYLKKNLEYCSIEVYNKSPIKLKSQINILTKELDTL